MALPSPSLSLQHKLHHPQAWSIYTLGQYLAPPHFLGRTLTRQVFPPLCRTGQHLTWPNPLFTPLFYRAAAVRDNGRHCWLPWESRGFWEQLIVPCVLCVCGVISAGSLTLRGNLSTNVVYSNRCHVTLAAFSPSTSLTGSAWRVCHLRFASLSPNEREVGLTLDPTANLIAPLRGFVCSCRN